MPEETSGVLIATMTVISIVIFGAMLMFAMIRWQRRPRGTDERGARGVARLYEQEERDAKNKSAPDGGTR
jgi:type II secretory pathway pseudopilin PulG